MVASRQSFDHALDTPKGWFEMAALDFSAKLSANVTIDPVYAGRCVHLNSDGEFEMGVTGHQMGIFLLQNSDDPDVATGGPSDAQGTIPAGDMSGLVAKGAYELETTEFDDDQDYAPNDGLRAIADNSNATTGGRLTNAGVTFGTTAVVGIVSKGAYTNSHNKRALVFWPVWCWGTVGN